MLLRAPENGMICALAVLFSGSGGCRGSADQGHGAGLRPGRARHHHGGVPPRHPRLGPPVRLGAVQPVDVPQSLGVCVMVRALGLQGEPMLRDRDVRLHLRETVRAQQRHVQHEPVHARVLEGQPQQGLGAGVRAHTDALQGRTCTDDVTCPRMRCDDLAQLRGTAHRRPPGVDAVAVRAHEAVARHHEVHDRQSRRQVRPRPSR